jgi:hypothetical protein
VALRAYFAALPDDAARASMSAAMQSVRDAVALCDLAHFVTVIACRS